jgi:hypothetical protein
MKILGWLAVAIGILLLVVAGIYLTTPAHALPSFFPGYDSTLTKVHRTHGIGALGLALVCFAFAWFQTGKKSTKKE